MPKIRSTDHHFLIILFTGIFISCSQKEIPKPVEKTIFENKDSFLLVKEKQEKFDLNQKIKIPHHWQSKNNKSIWISIATDFNTYLDFEDVSLNSYLIKDIKETKDSLIFITVFSKEKMASTINWYFKYQDKNNENGIWAYFNTRSGKYINTGLYRSIND